MDSLGEVGKKMRSAIKAKLVELGNESASGYIDDELPDYVMIMVANKRSKQQMLTDLNLFLGSNTETFVTWLHQVLAKLQEVNLPSTLATKAKKKISESTSKKDKKKDKKKSKEPSITDVIAVELMEKAKKTIDPKVKCEKGEKSETPSPQPAPQNNSPEKSSSSTATNNSSHHKNSSNNINRDDDLGFPTITEIQKTHGTNVLHQKELAQLEVTNNKIGETKRKLITLSNSERRDKSHDGDVEMRDGQQQQKSASVKSRLGVKTSESLNSNIISLSAIRRSETEFLKKIVVKQKEDNERKIDDYRSSRHRTDSSSRDRRDNRRDNRRSRSSSRDRHRNNRDRGIRNRKSRSRSPIKSSSSNRPCIRQRVGDRITSSQTNNSTKKNSKTPETDGNFKIKSRPTLSSTISAHAGKNLLLRAMADAQKSTQASSSESKRKQRDNIVVKVKNEKSSTHQNDEEYVPESISGHSESEAEYHPSYKNQENATTAEDDGDVIYLNNNDDDVDLDDEDEEMTDGNLVITIKNDENKKEKEKSKSPTPPPVIKRNKRIPVKDRISVRNPDNKSKDDYRAKKRHGDEQMETENFDIQRPYNKVKNPRVSPIKFDLTDDENEDNKSRSSSRDRSEKKSLKIDSDHNGDEHKEKRIKLEASRSFDHVPSLLSSITVPVADSLKPVAKSKERCKYYPSCQNKNCTFYHPLTNCKLFPNCKFGGDTCAYVHPICKFDMSCHRIDCNFTHTPILPSTTPIIASSIVPVQNYKSITLTPNMTVCKYFPGCANSNCVYQHPKICKFGKTCANKYECNFYHFELASKNKFKWVSSSS